MLQIWPGPSFRFDLDLDKFGDKIKDHQDIEITREWVG